jgi:hypothetical protein
MKIGQQKMELAKWVWEPKTHVGLAASNGFFSVKFSFLNLLSS